MLFGEYLIMVKLTKHDMLDELGQFTIDLDKSIFNALGEKFMYGLWDIIKSHQFNITHNEIESEICSRLGMDIPTAEAIEEPPHE